MKIVLIGYGAMGHIVERLALEDGHEVAVAPSSDGTERKFDALVDALRGHDAAIDFSVADAVPTNVKACMEAGVALVEGTTGWKEHETEVRRMVEDAGGAMVHGANFSIGVNLFYRIVQYAAGLFAPIREYDAFITEAHHKRKRDAPSGSALVIQKLVEAESGTKVEVSSTRAGYIPGTHSVGFDSNADQITLSHVARSREGFAYGAVFAAEWIAGRKGYFEFSAAIEDLVQRKVQ
jgi:4-hydroxy-tetrahydrodipicolinate reductase